MKKWKKFEREVFLEVKALVLKSGCHAELNGGYDSTISDILIKTKSGSSFYMEVKMPKSQSGQFVIENFNGKFLMSKRIKYSPDKFQLEIIEEINKAKNLEDFMFSNKLISSAIKAHYARKKTKYFVTKSDQIIIIPIQKIEDYFDLNIVIRKKKSGTRAITKKDFNFFKNNEEIFKGKNVKFIDDKIIVADEVEDKYFYDGFYLSEVRKNEYLVKKLSKTKNLTVLYTVSLKEKYPISEIETFIKDLM